MSLTPEPKIELALVVPVFNEEDCIRAVLQEWREALKHHVSRFLIIVIDDGSSDHTREHVESLEWPEIRIHTHCNRGHGQSCLVGYKKAAEYEAAFVFQIDSDGQCDPAAFGRIWKRRNDAPAVYGRRRDRDDGLARKLISLILRLMLKMSWHTHLNDANVPYRLYRTAHAVEHARRVPESFDLANIGLALLMEPLGFIEEPIPFRDRLGGHPSVRWWGFARKARRLIDDLKSLRHA